MDSLRYWVLEMHVDGFRFDLASALARELYEVNKLSAFFDVIHQDPVLSQVKLIAEPWDLGAGRLPGRQLSRCCGRSGTASTATACAASGAATAGRCRSSPRGWPAAATSTSTAGGGPTPASTSSPRHDGFTLQDLVSYNEKHNEANGEDNRDGEQQQPAAGTAASKGRPTIRPIIALRAAAEAQLHGHAAALARRADDLRRRRARPHPARQQQRLLPGQRDQLAATGISTTAQRDFLDFCRHLIRAAARSTRCSAGASSSRAAASAAPR